MHGTDIYNLSHIAGVQPGYLSRSRVRSTTDGTHWLLQARDVSLGNGIRLESAARFVPERNPNLYQIHQGDILLLARGQEHRAFLITENMTDVLASSVFYIIRPNRKLVLPDFLSWCLNQPDLQAKLEAASRGTDIGYISRPSVEQLVIAVPPMETQRQIAQAISLWHRHETIQARLNQAREQLIEATCRRAVREQEGATP